MRGGRPPHKARRWAAACLCAALGVGFGAAPAWAQSTPEIPYSTPVPPTPEDPSTPVPPTPEDPSTPVPPTPEDPSTPVPPTPEDPSTPVPPTPEAPTKAAPEGAAVPNPLAPTHAVYEGRLRWAGSRDPVPDARIFLLDSAQLTASDGEGRFRLPEAPLGHQVLHVLLADGQEAWVPIVVERVAAGPVDVYIRLEDPAAGAIVVTSQREDSPLGEREIRFEEVRMLPGAMGDPVRAIQSLPGVAWAPLSLGLLIVRGSNPEDSGFFLDGSPVPLVFHFLGLRTVVNGDMLERVTFLPGGFGVRYGRVLGGVIDLETPMGHEGRHHGYAEVDTFMSTVYASGPLDARTGYRLSLRRSYIDKVLAPVLQRIPLDYYIQAPAFWDYQVAVDHTPNDRHHMRLMVTGTEDNFAIFGETPTDADPEAIEEALLDYSVGMTQGQLRWESLIGEELYSELTVALGPQPNSAQYGDGEVQIDPWYLSVREELRYEVNPQVFLRGGLDAMVVWEHVLLDYPPSSALPDRLEAETTIASPSPYVEATLRLGDDLRLVPGLRADPWFVRDQPTLFTVDPRLSGRYQLRDNTVLKGSLGRFSSFPSSLELLDTFGNPNLQPEHGVQTSLGVEQALPRDLQLDLVGYFNRYQDLVVNLADLYAFDAGLAYVLVGTGADELYNNQGLGRAWGVEALLRRPFGDHLWGWLSTSVQRSQRKFSPDSDWYLFDYDQTLLMTAVASYELPRDWSLGVRFRYGTGQPYTPVVGRVYNVDSGSFSRVYGDINSARYPSPWSLDVRVARQWVFDTWRLDLYFDVQNAANHRNVESHYYSWDYAKLYYITGLPIVPVFGLRGAW